MSRWLLVAAAAFLFSGATFAQAKKPNVLVILADDLGYSDPGFMGGEIPTPHLDSLAKGGLRFTQCYNSARCCPSRAALMTGLYPHQAGIGSFARSRPDPRKGPAYVGHLNRQCVTLAEVLKSAGYQTYMVGKWHMSQPGPIARGFDEFYGFTRGYEQNQWDPTRYQRLPEGRAKERTYAEGQFYATDTFADYSLEFLKQARKKDKPWFLYLAHSAPHFPVQAPHKSVDRLVDTYRKGWDRLREDRWKRQRESGLATKAWKFSKRSLVPIDRKDIANGFPGKPNPAWKSLPQDRREDLARRMAVFAAMVSHIDNGIGRILADLKTAGELDNTLIVFASDNGACYEWGPFGFDGPSRKGLTTLHKGDALKNMGGPGTYHSYGSAWANLGNTPLRLYKHFTHEGGNCTPLIAHWPAGITKPNRWVRDPISLMDIMPTLCDVAGAKYPGKRNDQAILPAEGNSLVPVFRGKSLPERAIASEHNGSCSFRKGRWKIAKAMRMPNAEWELYDLSTDRCEITNLAGKHPQLTKKLAAEWTAWAKRVKVFPIFQPKRIKGASAPAIDRRPLTISLDVTLPTQNETGVLIAQGGREHGYSLHLEKGKLIFSTRAKGKVTATKPTPLVKSASIEARLKKAGEMELRIDGKLVANAKAPGLLPAQPSDPLSIGFDDFTAVGNYKPPLRLNAKITNVRLNGKPVRGK